MLERVDREVLHGFVEESRSYLPRILELTKRCSAAPDGAEYGEEIKEAHRLLHSLKGAAAMIGVTPLAHLALIPEDLLEDVLEGRRELSSPAVELVGTAVEGIAEYLDRLLEGSSVDEAALLRAVVVSNRRLHGLPEEGDEAELHRILGTPAPQPETVETPATTELPTREDTTGEAEALDRELLETFMEEAEEHLRQLSRGLQMLDEGSEPTAVVAELRRTIHTLKGSAGVVGLRVLSRVAHRLEDLLQLLGEGRLQTSTTVTELIRDSVQLLEDLIEQRGQPGALELQVENLFASFETLLDAEDDPFAPTPRADAPPPQDEAVDGFIEFLETPRRLDDDERSAEPPGSDAHPARETGDSAKPSPAADREETPSTGGAFNPSRALRIPLDRVDVLVRLVGELSVHRSVFQSTSAQLDQQIEELGLSSERVRRLSAQIEAEREFRPLPVAATAGGVYAPPAADGADPSFDPLEMESYTELDRMSRQLTEATSDISALRGQLGRTAEDFGLSLDLLGRLTADIQDRLLQLRMVPVGRLITRLRRTARRTAAEKGKRVEVEVTGGDIEIDTSLLDEIVDPLLHLLRNAIDHGIESPEVRAMLGKPEEGRIRLAASHSGPEVVLQVSDDGAGLDRSALRSAAVRAGLLSASQADQASDRELFGFIFQPGFSTAREVSEISGRGVGLDVVRTAIERLKGSVTVSSVDGLGVTFTLRLPITLALARVALVLVDGEMLAVPFSGIQQILRAEDQAVERIGERSMILVGERAVPRLDLAEVLQMKPPQTASAAERPLALVLAQGDQEVALGIDRLVEAREVVVRSLGSHLHPLSGISGATILGDGSVVLILNLAELLTGEVAELTPVVRGDSSTTAGGRDEILIVDDSLTVRRALSRIVADAGWLPVLARDGLEALQILQDDRHHPKALLLDIEMPRMDGYQLTATLRAQDSHRDVPIVIVTSRASERHRRKAFELGADDYLVKPLRETQLVDCLRGLLAGRGRSVS